MNGVISAGSPQTAQAGAEILKIGGNAADAAVAAAFVSFIAEISIVHLGGSGIAQIYDSKTGNGVVYDFFSTNPGLGAPPRDSASLDFQKIVVDFGETTQDFFVGRGSVAVPGNIYGLCSLHRDFGQLPLDQVLAPALKLARDGCPLEPFQASCLRLLENIFQSTDGVRTVFAPNHQLIEAGDHYKLPDLETTIQGIIDQGERYIRQGPLGQALTADQAAHGGALTPADLALYTVYRHAPIRIPYRDHEILLPKPSSTGGILTAFSLKLLSRFDLGKFDFGSADYLQILTEVMAATTRARPHWETARRELTEAEAIRRFLDDRFINDFANEVMTSLVKGRPSRVSFEQPSHNDTSHLSVVDANGLALSLTTTAGESAGYILEGTGFIANNMLGEADLFPEGFHTGTPGERIFTMMTPTIVLKDGKPRLVVGSGGSIRIRSAILQTIINTIDYAQELEAGITSPRVHLEEGVLQCEPGIPTKSLEELNSIGYQTNQWAKQSMYFGGAHCVAFEPDGSLIGAGDPRRNGHIAIA